MRWLVLVLALGCGSAPAEVEAETVENEVEVEIEVESEVEVETGVGRRRVTLSAAGDLVPNSLAMESVRGAATEVEGYRRFLEGYASAIGEDEIAYVNLEVPLVDDVVPLDGG